MSKKIKTKKPHQTAIKDVHIAEKRTGAWTQALVTLVFVLIPAIVMWVFLSTDFSNKHLLTTGQLWGVAIGFIIYAFAITMVLVGIQLIWIDTMNFTFPIAIVLMSILLSQDMKIWARALIAIALIFTALPVNMMTVRFIERKIKKTNEKKKIK